MTTTRSTRNAALPAYRHIALQERDGEVFARYTWRRYRFMFSDGATLDVNAIRDDSDLREAVLVHHYGKTIKDPKDGSIVGVATLPDVEPEAKSAPAKRVAKRAVVTSGDGR